MEEWIDSLVALEQDIREGYEDANGDWVYLTTQEIADDIHEIAFELREEFKDIRVRIEELAHDINRKEHRH